MKLYSNQPGLERELAKKRFDTAVMIEAAHGPSRVCTTEEARDILSSPDWPNRGPRHADALETCLKVLDGHRSTIDAQNAFVEAAREASILLQQ
jgi:hypothetical protein